MRTSFSQSGGPRERAARPVGPVREARAGRSSLPLPVAFLLLGLVVPFFIYIGPLRLTPYRILLLAMFLPCVFLWISGRAGRIRLADICVVVICVWSSLSFSVLHGTDTIEASGMLFIEILGPYLMGRCFIRTPEQFLAMARFLLGLVLILLPLGIYENVTGQDLVLRVLRLVGPVPTEVSMEPRMGFDRAQGPFDHPILLGVFCGSTVGLTYYVIGYGHSMQRRLRDVLAVVVATFSSLSSGPLSAVVIQIMLIGWDRATHGVANRWRLFTGLAVFCYVAIDVLSNRTPIVVLIHYLAFSASTGMNRVLIWDYGTQNIIDNPIFGLGFNDWENPYWMSDSVDMFWILGGMRHGVLVLVLYFAMFFLITIPIARLRNLSLQMFDYRMGYIVTMAGFFICGWMVHFWNQALVIFMFLLASGVWMLDHKPEAEVGPPSGPDAVRRGRGRRTVL